MFKDKESYIKYIENSNYLEYDIIGELLTLPNVLSTNGLFYFIFDKKIKIIKKNLEKDIMVENYYLQCLNYENNYLINTNKDYIILIKDGKYYFPIYNVRKKLSDKKIVLKKMFTNDDYPKILTELKQYYNLSCVESFIFKINKTYNITAKFINTFNIDIKKQIVDMRNKVRYLKLDNGLLLPVKPSGTILNIPVMNINTLKQSDMLPLDITIKLLNKFNSAYPTLNYVPKVINYNNIKDNNYNVISILLMNNMIIPIKSEYMSAASFKKFGLGYEFQSLEEVIDNVITENEIPYDNRTINVKNRLYRNESYNLFRLELSIYLSNNPSVKTTITNIVRNQSININNKRKELFDILMKIIEGKLSKNNKMLEIIKELPNLNN